MGRAGDAHVLLSWRRAPAGCTAHLRGATCSSSSSSGNNQNSGAAARSPSSPAQATQVACPPLSPAAPRLLQVKGLASMRGPPSGSLRVNASDGQGKAITAADMSCCDRFVPPPPPAGWPTTTTATAGQGTVVPVQGRGGDGAAAQGAGEQQQGRGHGGGGRGGGEGQAGKWVGTWWRWWGWRGRAWHAASRLPLARASGGSSAPPQTTTPTLSPPPLPHHHHPRLCLLPHNTGYHQYAGRHCTHIRLLLLPFPSSAQHTRGLARLERPALATPTPPP